MKYIINNEIIELSKEPNPKFYKYVKLNDAQLSFLSKNPTATAKEVLNLKLDLTRIKQDKIVELKKQIEIAKNTPFEFSVNNKTIKLKPNLDTEHNLTVLKSMFEDLIESGVYTKQTLIFDSFYNDGSDVPISITWNDLIQIRLAIAQQIMSIRANEKKELKILKATSITAVKNI